MSLLEDQAHVLDQIVDLALRADVDAVLIAGDVYDRSAPPADAVRLLDETLTRLVLGAGKTVVMIAGNHDSPDRVGFASRLLEARGLIVAGSRPLRALLADDAGDVEVLALPYAEPVAVGERLGVPSLADHEAALRADLAALGAPAAKRRVVVAHVFAAGGATSESERPLVLGTAALVGASCFEGFDYAALGHLHRAQKVGREEVRYSGSPLAYAFDEAGQTKSVAIATVGPSGGSSVEVVPLSPRRAVRVLDGTLAEILREADRDPAREDFVLARLRDRGAILDPMGKLREVYPHCLAVDREAFFAERRSDGGARADLRRHGERDLFDAFFREVAGEEPSREEAAAFEGALRQARRGEASR